MAQRRAPLHEDDRRNHVKGLLYLIHFDPPYRHAMHYLGYTESGLRRRLQEHIEGTGSPLVRAAVEAGSECRIVRVWRHATRFDERRLKHRNGHAPTFCPRCSPITGADAR